MLRSLDPALEALELGRDCLAAGVGLFPLPSLGGLQPLQEGSDPVEAVFLEALDKPILNLLDRDMGHPATACHLLSVQATADEVGVFHPPGLPGDFRMEPRPTSAAGEAEDPERVSAVDLRPLPRPLRERLPRRLEDRLVDQRLPARRDV